MVRRSWVWFPLWPPTPYWLGLCQYNVTGWDRSHDLPALSRVWQHIKLSVLGPLRNQTNKLLFLLLPLSLCDLMVLYLVLKSCWQISWKHPNKIEIFRGESCSLSLTRRYSTPKLSDMAPTISPPQQQSQSFCKNLAFSRQ